MKKIITASLVAMMAVTAAHADIASTAYVDTRTGEVDNSTFVKTLGEGKKNLSGAVDALAEKLENGNFTIPEGVVTSAMIADGTIVDKDISANAAIAQTKIAGLGDALNSKVDKNQGKDKEGSGLVVGAQGNLELVDVATQNELDTAVEGLGSQIEGISGGVATDLNQFKSTIAADIAAKVSIDQTESNANKAMITDDKGQVKPGQIATDMIVNSAVTRDKLEGDVQSSLALADSAMQESVLKTLVSWTEQKCGTEGVTCSLVSKNGNIAWEAVKY